MPAPISISQVTKCVKRNKQTIKISLNTDKRFEQNSEFIIYRDKKNKPLDADASILNANATNESNTDILYNNNQVIDIPQKLNDIFDNVLGDDYYLFGVNKDVSFIMSLLYIISKDFKLKEQKTQLQFCQELKKSLIEQLPKYFKEKSYSALNFNRTQMENNLENDIYNNEIINYISDFYNLNLIVFDYNKSSYISSIEYNDTRNNVIIIVNDHIYLPLVHIYGEFPNKFIYKCLVNKFKTSNKIKQISQPIPSSSLVTEASNTEASNTEVSNTEASITLKALSSYKLNELQEIASKLNISLSHSVEGKNKKKTKSELYNQIKIHN